MSLLKVSNLHTYFDTYGGTIKAVNGIDYSVDRGKTLGIVGESGSGKSVAALSILNLLDANGYINKGSIKFKGKELTKLNNNDMREIRGKEIAFIFQQSMTSLNPVLTIKKQICETLISHENYDRKETLEKACNILESVNITNVKSILKKYPYQLSAGMRQRVIIAIALACNPELLIADEPTTALDVTIQAQILNMMTNLKEKNETSIIFISHDLGVINYIADDIAVMYCGEIIEACDKKVFFSVPLYMHPYSEALLKSVPSINSSRDQKLDCIYGSAPQPFNLPCGCKFAPRCPYATKMCENEVPPYVEVELNHKIKCFYPNRKERQNEYR